MTTQKDHQQSYPTPPSSSLETSREGFVSPDLPTVNQSNPTNLHLGETLSIY